ncbi:MAG: ABC transporter substrate-binding protein [Lachnospiraceae bacterium]|nr:ABC transporter substrate-binding protein [Lachnospiraceae bacterium]
MVWIRNQRKVIWILLALVLCLCSGCSKSSSREQTTDGQLVFDHSMKLQYAMQFGVDYYQDGYKVITLSTGEKFLVVPEGKEVPVTEEKMTVIRQPLQNIYMVSSSQMDLLLAIDGLSSVKMTGTKENDWYIDEIKTSMQNGDVIYAGKYSAPDYEMILANGCDLAVENTMIYHKPEVKEKIEELGIPVIVEQSSTEAHPLGRVEWIKLYGVLLDKEDEAEAFFEKEISDLNNMIGNEKSEDKGATVGYFYVNSRGVVNVRKSGDYIAKMIEMAGGTYLFDNLTDENALSTMNIQMEEFIEKATDADYLIYNSSIDGNVYTIEELLGKCPELKDSKAVKEGNVWCTEKNMFQETTGISKMILEFYYMMTGEDYDFKYMYKLK